jgi:thiol-disulfide isomerase/thioredoxin
VEFLSRGKGIALGVGVVVAAVLAYLLHGTLEPFHGPVTLTPTKRTLQVETKTGASRDLALPPGKLLVLHFWATWCPPCVEEMPGLLAFSREIKSDRELELLTVSVDKDWKTVDEWLKAHGGADLPLALDPSRSVANRMGTQKFPETYVISAAGNVIGHVKGPLDWTSREVRAQIDEFKRASAAPAAATSATSS